MRAAHLLAFLGGEVGVGTFTRSRPRFGQWVQPSCHAGIHSGRRTRKTPTTPEDFARLRAAECKRIRKALAKWGADAAVVLPPSAEVSYLFTRESR